MRALEAGLVVVDRHDRRRRSCPRCRSGGAVGVELDRLSRLVRGPSSALRPAASSDLGRSRDGVADGHGDAAPVGIRAVDGRLEQVARDHGPGCRASVDVVAATADGAGDERGRALAVGGLLPGQRAGHGLDGAAQSSQGLRDRARAARRRRRPRPPAARCRWWTGRRRRWSGSRCGPRSAAAGGCSVSGWASASVSTKLSIVAMLGWIMPTPLATPLTVTVTGGPVGPGSRTRTAADLGPRVGRAQGLGHLGEGGVIAAATAAAHGR